MSYTLKKKGLQRFPVSGARLVYRYPTTEEYVHYKDGISIMRHADGKLVTEATDSEIELVNAILIDVEDFKYETADGQEEFLTKDTPVSALTHFEEAFGHPITSWKDVIPVTWKTGLAFRVLGGMGEQEKNS